MPDLRYRYRGLVEPKAGIKTPVRAEGPDGEVVDGIATLRLYDPVDSWGGWWGVSAKEFAETLDNLGSVDEIRLHINSPGGEVWEGIAIKNLLRAHPARVVSVVDGLAASIASVIAVGGSNEVVMGEHTELMIHDAWGLCVGNAGDMRDLADRLDKVSDNIATIYRQRAGGTVEDWRANMLAETWYSAEEAVNVGLADRVEGVDDDAAKNAFDLSMFRYGGRASAPAPTHTPEREDLTEARTVRWRDDDGATRATERTRHLDHVERVMRGYAARYRLPL